MNPATVLERAAAALGRAVPSATDDAVRLLVDGAKALGQTELVGPWRHEFDVAGSGHDHFDDVARSLAALPRRLPLAIYASGPVWLATDGGVALDQNRLDDAVDAVAERLRALAALRPDRIVVLEPDGEAVDGLAQEAHQTLHRIAAHFAIPFGIERPQED